MIKEDHSMKNVLASIIIVSFVGLFLTSLFAMYNFTHVHYSHKTERALDYPYYTAY